ncbi:MAG: YcxB family protein [Bacteroidia bacterium]|jgi:hypothetical protein
MDKKKYRTKIKILMVLLALLIETLFYFLVMASPLNLMSILILLGLGLLLLWYGLIVPKEYFLSVSEKMVNRIIKEGKNQDLLGKHHLEIMDDHMVFQTENSKSTFSNRMIEKILQDEDYFFLYLNAMSAIIIPKNSFLQTSDKMKFMQIMKSWV